ncbi:MAG: hypothetical protein NW241_02465 [Bacteroidia bacterium]|nr:hypothetical protein [Bacteroidia bacterium]
MKILLTGNMGAGKSTVARQVLAAKPGLPFHAIDACRRQYGDGSMAQEAVARTAFLEAIQAAGPMLIECTGLGDLGLEVRAALGSDPLTVILLEVPLPVCLARLAARTWDVPYPGTPETAAELCVRSHAQYEAGAIHTRFHALAAGRIYVFPHLNAGDTRRISACILTQLDHETT